MTRGRRPDVVERRNLDDGYKEQEIGFRISTTVEETGGKKAVLKFWEASANRHMKLIYRN